MFVERSLWKLWRADMSARIYLVILFIQYITHAVGGLYISEKTASASEAAFSCKLATPDINFGRYGNTVSLVGADLNIAYGESVWSGYVQTYAAFLYEGCCDVQFANSSANHTNIYMGPGECYSKCKTEVFGIQTSTCHCNPRPEDKYKYATGCDTTCSYPNITACGGENALSIYRKVQHPGYGENGMENTHCRALRQSNKGQRFYKWEKCGDFYHTMCGIGGSPSDVQLHSGPGNWRHSAEKCLRNYQKPAAELSSGVPDLSVLKNVWIGQIRSQVIVKESEQTDQNAVLRRGVIAKTTGGSFVLQFNQETRMLLSLCENVSTSTPSSDTTSQSTHLASSPPPTNSTQYQNGSKQKSTLDDDPPFPMIAVFAGVPAVVVLVAVVVIVILCKRRHKTKESSPRPEPDVPPNDYVTGTTHPSKSGRDPEKTAAAARNDEYAVVIKKAKPEHTVTTDHNEYDTTVAFSSLKHTETDDTYNRLNAVTDNNGDGDDNEVDHYDHAVSDDRALKTSKGNKTGQNGLYDTALDVSRLEESQANASEELQDMYAQPIPRSQRK